MTILYKVESKEFGKDSVFPQKVVLCSVSARNIIAFSSLQSAIVSHGPGDSSSGAGVAVGASNSHVYVSDIVTPWEYYKVCSSKSLINVLEWSANGEQLLLGYVGGRVEIWQPKHQSINIWLLQYHANIPSEDIIEAKFFHNGKGVLFNPQKKEHTYYAEKFERLEQRPTLSGFGGVASEGCILLTSSGLLGAFSLPLLQKFPSTEGACSEIVELTPVMHSIGISRSFIEHCSMAPSPSGAVNVAFSCGWQQQLVQCFKISLVMEGDLGLEQHMAIKSESQASIFLNPLEGKLISHLKWTRVANDDVIFIAYSCPEGGSLLEQWTLTRRHQSVHTLLQGGGSNKGNEFVQSESWEQVAKLHLNAPLADLCLSRLVPTAADCSPVYAILQDNSVQVLEPNSLKQLNHTQFDKVSVSDGSGVKFVSGDLTPTSQMLLIFDTHAQLYAMQAPPLKQSGSALLLLEYCIVTGCDASDVLLLNLGSLEPLVEKLTDNFSRQPSFVKNYYYANFLALKSNLCRVQQQEFDNLIILHAISTTFKSLLRPSDLGYQDKGPADNLTTKLNESIPDVDTVMLNLDAKDFTVEPVMLQSLQPLIQWVTDLAVNMLNRLPEEVMKCKLSGKRPSYDISRDINAISSLRELLVMIRIWGLLNTQCLPVYTKIMENIDVLVILFRLLTRLAQNPAEPDDMLLDECSLLSKQLLIPQLNKFNPTTLLSAQGFAAVKSGHLMFTSLVEPTCLQDMEVEDVVFARSVKDGVSNLQLGAHPTTIRRCARCGFVFVNNANKVAKTSALKAWFNKWLHCHCGGFWKQIN
ncbi:mediator of RNA polymerase II transcription subunit 16 [Drosophila guanche]|uniref:Mediator of RNA polymerase II transcription subunit 16 n=1 Tax=Drosophila guanche TaxID=7266 RepID=A0A3B0JJI4_DROGU|nr:mediator of RNA polymerase II transcription subunit 16 [Drosophila guanche]SPP72761.1 blast:Mediator of RNA polymerase II transcription subunit 16 [Drosophila guanche]